MADLLYEEVVEVSESDAEQSLLELLDDVGFTATSYQPFSDELAMIHLAAEFRARASKISALLKTVLLADQSVGEAQTAVSRSFYDHERNKAVETQLLVLLNLDADHGPYTIDVGELTLTHPPTGNTYRNVEGASIVYPYTFSPSGATAFLFEAEVAGGRGNIAPAASPTFVELVLDSSLAGVTINSYQLERSGVDEEQDDRLRARNQLRWTDVGAIELFDDRVRYYALQAAPAVVTVGVDSTNPRGQGTFDVYIAGLDASASVSDVTAVQDALDLRVCGRNATTPTCIVYQAPIVTLGITGHVYFSGASAADVQAAVEAALVDYVRSVPPGGFTFIPGPANKVPKNDLETVMKNAALTLATRVTVKIDTPSDDVAVVAYGKVIRGTWNIIYQQSTQ
jgi:hypothetical protein